MTFVPNSKKRIKPVAATGAQLADDFLAQLLRPELAKFFALLAKDPRFSLSFSYAETRLVHEHFQRILLRSLAASDENSKESAKKPEAKQGLPAKKHAPKKLRLQMETMWPNLIAHVTANFTTELAAKLAGNPLPIKQRKAFFFAELQKSSAPHWQKFNRQLEVYKALFAERKIDLKMHPSLENFSLCLKGISSEKEWQEAIQVLQTLPVDGLLQLLNGKKDIF